MIKTREEFEADLRAAHLAMDEAMDIHMGYEEHGVCWEGLAPFRDAVDVAVAAYEKAWQAYKENVHRRADNCAPERD